MTGTYWAMQGSISPAYLRCLQRTITWSPRKMWSPNRRGQRSPYLRRSRLAARLSKERDCQSTGGAEFKQHRQRRFRPPQ